MHIYRLLDGPNLAGLLGKLDSFHNILENLVHALVSLQSTGVSSAG